MFNASEHRSFRFIGDDARDDARAEKAALKRVARFDAKMQGAIA
jgi:hypothetical protein